MSSTYNPKLEEAAIVKIIRDGDNFPLLDGIVEPESFGWSPYGVLWKGIEHLHDTGVEINSFTLQSHFERTGQLQAIMQPDGGLRGEAFFDYLSGEAVLGDWTSTGIESIGKQLQDTGALRAIVEIADKMKGDALRGTDPSDILGHVDERVGRIVGSVGANVQSIESGATVAKQIYDDFKDAAMGESRYIETGLNAFDRFVGGMFPGNVIVPAATSGSGKSTLAQNIIYWLSMDAGDNNIPSAIISFEMENPEVGARFIQFDSGISPIDILKGNVSDVALFQRSLQKLKDSKIHFDDSATLTLPQIRVKLRKLVGLGVRFCVCDQLDQIEMGDGYPSNYGDADRKIYKLKSYAREFGIPLIVPHQLNKSVNSFQRKNPFAVTLADLKESGEKGADSVVFIRKDDGGRNALIWTKARLGDTGMMFLDFDMDRRVFKNLDTSELRDIEMDYSEGYDNDEL